MKIAKTFNKMFSDRKVRTAFRAVKNDMDILDENHVALKDCVNEWVIFLDHENRDLRARVRDLEKRLALLQDSVEESRLTVLREI